MENIKNYDINGFKLYNPCKYAMYLDNNDEKIRYITSKEFFPKNISFYERFIKKLKFGKTVHEYHNNKTITVYASGTNTLMIRMIINDKEQKEIVNDRYILCDFNDKSIKCIYDEITFTGAFLNRYFIFSPENAWINDKSYILCPNLFLSELSINDIRKIYKEKNKEKIYSVLFDIIIKIDNYDVLKETYEYRIYNKQPLDDIKKIFSLSPYRNIYFLKKNDVNLLSNINISIQKWFYDEYGIPEDDIYISLQFFNYNIPWITMFVYLKKKSKGEYVTFSTFYHNRQISLTHFINMANATNIEIPLMLNSLNIKLPMNKGHFKYFKCCNNIDVTNNNTIKFIKKKIYSDIPINKYLFTESHNSHTIKSIDNHIIVDGKFNKNLKVNRILSQKVSNIYNICSVSVCCTIDDESYIITIIPKTPEYLLYLYNNKLLKDDLLIYLFGEEDIGELYNMYNYLIKYKKHTDLKYLIEIVKINPYKCIGVSNEKHKFGNIVDKYITFIKDEYIIELNESFESSNIFTKILRKKFITNMFIFIYALIRCVIICYRNSNGKYFNKCVNVIKKILKLENNFYKHKNIKDAINDPNNELGEFDVVYKVKYACYNYKNREFYESNTPYYINENIMCPFIGVQDFQTIKSTKPQDFKVFIWYSMLNVFDIKKITTIVSNLSTLKNKLYDQNINSFDLIKLDYNILQKILKNIVNIDDVLNNYLFNISSLIQKKENTYYCKPEKQLLDDFIKECIRHFSNDSYKHFVYFHYPPSYDFNTLHIHIINSFSKYLHQTLSIRNIINVGESITEISDILSFDYYKFFCDGWSKIHTINLYIDNILQYSKYIKSQEYIDIYHNIVSLYNNYNENNKLLVNIVSLLIKSKIMTMKYYIPEEYLDSFITKFFTKLFNTKHNAIKVISVLYRLAHME